MKKIAYIDQHAGVHVESPDQGYIHNFIVNSPSTEIYTVEEFINAFNTLEVSCYGYITLVSEEEEKKIKSKK